MRFNKLFVPLKDIESLELRGEIVDHNTFLGIGALDALGALANNNIIGRALGIIGTIACTAMVVEKRAEIRRLLDQDTTHNQMSQPHVPPFTALQ